MTENTVTHWPGVRVTHDGKYSFSLNVCNALHIENGFYDAELAAQSLDQAKYLLVQSGHMRRSNYFFFPDEIAKWDSGVEFCPGPSESLRRFMAAHQPRYLTLAERNAVAQSVKVETIPLPSQSKICAMHYGLSKIILAAPSRLTDDQRSACKTVLELLAVLRDE